MSDRAKHPVETTRKTINILRALRRLEGARVTELATELDMHKSTVHNHLSTLQEEELIVRDDEQYELGFGMLEFGGYVRHAYPLYRMAAPEIERIAEQTGELANLMVEEYGRGIYLDCQAGNRAVSLNIYPGLRRLLHVTALGKATLAFLPESRVNNIIERFGLPKETERTITDRDELRDALGTIADEGIAYDDEEYIPGLRCVATPILDTNDRPLGAISISAPTKRMNDETFYDEVPDLLRSASNVIELNVTHS